MGFCDLPLADAVCAVGQAVDFASDPGKAIGDWMAKSAGELAAASADLAAKAVDSTTAIDLNAPWFRDNYATILPIGLVVLVATFCAQLVRAALRRDGQALTQAFSGTASGAIFAFAAIALTTVAIDVVDALSAGLLAASDLTIETAVRRIVKIGQLGALSGLGWLVMVFAALSTAIGAFLYWCVMMVRKVGILVLVTLAVFAGAGGGWEAARRWRRGWIEATATLVVSKLLMTIIWVLGIAAIGKTEAKDGVAALADVLAGIVVMVLVLLCPYATFKFVHWAAEGSDGETLHRAGGAGIQIARQHAERAGRKAATLTSTGGAAAVTGADGISAAGRFPGDIAPNPAGNDSDGGQNTPASKEGDSTAQGTATTTLHKTVRPTPSPGDDTGSRQVLGDPGMDTTPDETSGWPSNAPTTSPPPQGTPPSTGSLTDGHGGPIHPAPPTAP
ncbi:ATP-binding protein [Streptomyces sp. NPDC001508]|uniref:SCO6881 family protein n=1 Tax=Streptomyces sp. NPDC001508 TaxID=3154656 RepID=UPI00331FA4EC